MALKVSMGNKKAYGTQYEIVEVTFSTCRSPRNNINEIMQLIFVYN